MSEEIKKTLEDVKRHLDYVEATKQASIRDNEMKTMYNYITNLQKENNQHISDIQVLMNKKENLERLTKKLQQELDQYKNNWEELKKWLEQEWLEWKDCEDARTKNFATEDKIILNKMKELEEKNGKN